MSTKNKKQFGVWMDGHHAIIVGRTPDDNGDFAVLAHERNPTQGGNSNENAANNLERTAQLKFFKQISAHMPNVEALHVTGTGQAQEQFIHFLAEQPQFKNAAAAHSTTQKMDEAKLVEYIAGKFNG